MLDISHALKNPGQIYPLEAEVCLPDMEVMGETLSFENARFSGELLGAGESVSVKGTVRADVIAHCARCLAPVRHAVAGTEIELMDLVKDAVVLDLPMRFLCKEDCKGLCPKCGANRNEHPCNCLEGDDDNPFAALRDLF